MQALATLLPREARIVISEEPERAGTGGAVFHARDRLADRFLLCNGDSLFDCNLARLLADAAGGWSQTCSGASCCAGWRMRRATAWWSWTATASLRSGRAAPRAGRDCGPAPRSHATGGVINAGIYVYDRRLLDELTPKCSLERDVMPRLAARGALRGTVADGYFRDIGIPTISPSPARRCHALLHRRALFLDRDGVINVDHGYVGAREQFEWMPGAREAIRAATDAGWHVFVVTNQSGIARGRYYEAEMQALHVWMTDEIRRAGGTLDDLRFCPFHADAVIEAYRHPAHPWRKPAPGMLLDLMRAWQIDPARCVLADRRPAERHGGRKSGRDRGAAIRRSGVELVFPATWVCRELICIAL